MPPGDIFAPDATTVPAVLLPRYPRFFRYTCVVPTVIVAWKKPPFVPSLA